MCESQAQWELYDGLEEMRLTRRRYVKRAHLAELGIVATQGREGLKDLLSLPTKRTPVCPLMPVRA
jgi:hypothetical protein